MESQSRYMVTLLNQQLNLVSDKSQDAVAIVCERVDALLDQISKKNPSISKTSIALVAAIALAEELVTLEGNVQRCLEAVSVAEECQ